MKKIIIIAIVFFIFLFSFVYAISPDHLVACYNMTDGNDTLAVNNASIGIDIVAQGNPINNSPYYWFDADNNMWNAGASHIFNWSTNKTFMVLANYTASPADTLLSKKQDFMIQSNVGDSGNIQIYCWGTSDYITGVGDLYPDADPHQIVISINGSFQFSVYKDGARVYSGDGSSCGDGSKAGENFYIGSYDGSASPWGGGVFQVAVWNTSLSDAQVTEIYSGGSYTSCYSLAGLDADTTPPILAGLDTNATNTTNSGQKVNLSATCDDDIAAGQIWYGKFDGTTYTNSSSFNYIDNQIYTFNITIVEAQGTDINLTIWCNDSSGNEAAFAGWKGFTVASADTQPIITQVYPLDKVTYNDYNGWLNFTTNVGSNCSVTNNSWIAQVYNSTYYYYYNSNSLPEGNHSLNITCYNGTSTNGTSELTFFVDTTSPTLITNLKNNDTITLDNFTIQANLTDNIKIYSLNVSTSEEFVNYTANINATSYTWDYYFNESNSYGLGLHEINFKECDAHTTEKIKDYDYILSLDDKKIKYNFNNKYYSIEPRNPDHFTEFNTYKLTNKYAIEYTKKKEYKDKEEDYIIKSTDKIDIIGDNRFTGWLVIPSLEKWIDFENEKKEEATIKKVSDNEVIITTKASNFKSTGDLNCINKSYVYHKYNYKQVYESYALESTSINLSLDLQNITVSYFNLSKIDARLIYNNTIYTPTKYNGSDNINFTVSLNTPELTDIDDSLAFYWNYTFNGIDTFNTTTQNQTITQFIIDNCTSSGNVTLTMDIYNEESPTTKLNATIEMVINYTTGNRSKNASYILEGDSNYNICIYPANASIYTDMYIKYNSSGGFTHRYYLVNESLTNITKNISLYNFDTTTGISDLKATIREELTYTYLPNIITKLQRYYPGTNTWRTVQMDESGDFGLTFFNIKEENTDYRFIFMDRGNHVLDTTESMKFVCESAICELTFMIQEYDGTGQAADLDITYSYDNTTGNVSISWNDVRGVTQNVRLLVTKETMTGTTTICDNSINAASGSLSCDVSAYTGAILVRVFSTASPEMPQFFKWINRRVGKLSSVLPASEGAFWSAGIMATVIGFGAVLGPVGAIIATIFGLVVLLFLDLFTVITIGLITTACVIGIIIGLVVKR